MWQVKYRENIYIYNKANVRLKMHMLYVGYMLLLSYKAVKFVEKWVHFEKIQIWDKLQVILV